MRWVLGLLILAVGSAVLGFLSIKRIPYNYYAKWIRGEGWNKYYVVQDFKKLYLESPKLEAVNDYKEPYEELWKVFPITNALIPLPVRHPLYQTFPIVEFNQYRPHPHAGISLTSSGAREIIRFYTIPMSLFKDFSLGQELFKLPFVRNRLMKVPQDKLWQDIFSRKIEERPSSMEEIFYNLYLIHLRSKLLPKGAIRYGLIKNGTQVLVELESRDKDYKVEIVMHERSGNIYSYVLRTAINNEESKKLRDKFLGSVDFTPSDPAVGRILHTEFKQLNFARQVDQEGIQYLYSAWTQNMKSEEALKELIFYMERGRGNTQRLQPFYRYAIKKYGKTFTLRTSLEDSDDTEVALQRKIELEDARFKADLLKEKNKPAPVPDLTPDERMNLYLKKARENKKVNEKEMTVH
jgi:hypothetical protein